jgi:hypothetical protein
MSRIDCGVFARPDWRDSLVNRRFLYLMDYMYWIGNDVTSYARDKDLFVNDIKKEDAIRPKVELALAEVDPIFFFHASHGGPAVLTGQNMSNMISCPPYPNPNHEVLSNRVTYTLSCSSAAQLGPAVVEAKGLSYIGYGQLLWICLLESPEVDGAFRDIWGGGAKVLIDGGTTHDAYMWLKRRYLYWIAYWEMSPNSIAPVMLFCLKSDLRGLRLIGMRDARIRSMQKQIELKVKKKVDIDPYDP